MTILGRFWAFFGKKSKLEAAEDEIKSEEAVVKRISSLVEAYAGVHEAIERTITQRAKKLKGGAEEATDLNTSVPSKGGMRPMSRTGLPLRGHGAR